MSDTITAAEQHYNEMAARIAARQVAQEAYTSPRHRASLEAWQRGERNTPWPDPTLEEQAAADAVMIELAEAFLGHKLPTASGSTYTGGMA